VHGQPQPIPRNSRAKLMSDKEHPQLRKGSPHSPQGVLPGTPSLFDNLDSQAGGDPGRPAASNATNATGCYMKSKNPHPGDLGGARPGRPTRPQPLRKHASQRNATHRNATQHKSRERPHHGSAHAPSLNPRTSRSEPKFLQPRKARQNFN